MVLLADSLGDGGKDLRCRRGEGRRRGRRRGPAAARAWRAAAADLPRKGAAEWKRRGWVGRWGTRSVPIKLNASLMLDGLNRLFQSIRIRPAVEKSLHYP